MRSESDIYVGKQLRALIWPFAGVAAGTGVGYMAHELLDDEHLLLDVATAAVALGALGFWRMVVVRARNQKKHLGY